MNVWGLHGAKILEEMKIASNLLFFVLCLFLKKTELYNIFNQFPFLEMGKILKFLTEDNQFNFLVIKEPISQSNVKHNRLAMHC